MYGANTISRMFETAAKSTQPAVTSQMVARTYTWFSKGHPQEVLDLLNSAFLVGEGQSILEEYANGTINRHTAATVLAELRNGQLDPNAPTSVRKQRKADLVMASDSFLKFLRTELN